MRRRGNRREDLRRRLLPACLIACLALVIPYGRTAKAQKAQPTPIRLLGVFPSGVRRTATSSWGAFSFDLSNFADTDQQARILVSFKDFPQVQYGRDVWVPAHANLSTWMLVGPAPANHSKDTCDIQMVVQDLSKEQNQTVLPKTEERLRSRGILYRRRELSTSLLIEDEDPFAESPLGQLPQPDSPTVEAMRLARVFRQTRRLSETVNRVSPLRMPPTAEALDGIDHLVLASNALTQNPAGMIALRHWLEQGGKIWVLLDFVEPELLSPLLGDTFDFQIVDRISLTSFRIERHPKGKGMDEPPLQQHERPVAFVRVQLPPEEQAPHTINGWPVWFTRRVGRGEVVFSTLGPRGWYRKRKANDPSSPYQNFPKLPIATHALENLVTELQPSDKKSPFRVESLQPLLAEEIGYSVVRRDTVVLIFGAALLVSLVLGLVLRTSRRPELLGWLGPAAALGATAVFLVVGERSRRAVPPTVAVAQIIETIPGKDEMAVHGMLEIYRPNPGPVEAGAKQGGLFELDARDMQGQVRQFILTDLDTWHWERVSLLAEPRKASFHVTLPTEKPIAALAHFGPAGLEGKLSGPFQNLSDALLSTATGRRLAVHIQPDGAFHAAGSDVLPRERYLSGTILTDRQQRRQDFYAAFLKDPGPIPPQGRNDLLVWTDPLDMHFHIEPGARVAGSALVVAPLRLERLAPGGRATIPAPFLPYQRILDGQPVRPPLEASDDLEMHLRFQLPAEVLPFKVERARFSARLEAPGRRVAIAAQDGNRFAELHHVESPLDPIRIEIAEERLLHVDEEGGLHLRLTIGDPSQNDALQNAPPQPDPPQDIRPRGRGPRGGKFQGGPGGNRPPRRRGPGPGGGRPPEGGPPRGVSSQEAPPSVKVGLLREKWAIQYLELEVSGQRIAAER